MNLIKNLHQEKVSGVTITNNGIKDSKTVIKSLESKGVLLKGITRKITSQEEGFLNFLRPLITAGIPLIRNVLTPLAKNLLLQLGLLVRKLAADVAIQKKSYGSGHLSDLASRTTALIISSEETWDIMKWAESLEESGMLVKRIRETVKNEKNQQRWGFLPMLLGALAAGTLGNELAGRGVTRAREGTIKAGKFLTLPHPLTNF